MINYSSSAPVYSRSFDSNTVDFNETNNSRISINVAGLHYETYENTLARYPETLLGCSEKRAKYYDPVRDEYRFPHANRIAFDFILFYYQSGGKLVFPVDLPENVFLEEVKFFEMDKTAELKWQTEHSAFSSDSPLLQLQGRSRNNKTNRTTRESLWAALTTWTSTPAKIMSWLCIGFITSYVAIFCLKTLPEFRAKYPSDICANEQPVKTYNSTYRLNAQKQSDFDLALFWSVCEKICTVWFLLEFMLRIVSSPSKKNYFLSGAAIADSIAFLPYFALIILQCHVRWTNKPAQFHVLERTLKFFTVSCLLKLARYSFGLRLVWLTLRSSVNELLLLIYCVLISVVVFSSLLYYVEDSPDFQSIPGSFWFAIITMTTVGYGDVVPVTIIGKIIGALCGLFGVTYLMALPTTVIVSNFSRFYQKTKHAKAKNSLTRQTSKESGQRSLMRRESLQRWISNFQTVT